MKTCDYTAMDRDAMTTISGCFKGVLWLPIKLPDLTLSFNAAWYLMIEMSPKNW